MGDINPPVRRCFSCGGQQMAILRNFKMETNQGWTNESHDFVAVMCTHCGRTDFFAIDPADVVKDFGKRATIVTGA